MTLSQIRTLLNTTMVPNLLGEETTLSEDLSNVVTLGKAVASLSSDDLKDYMKEFAVGVITNYMDTKKYNRETFGLFVDAIEYGGAVQRVKARLMKAYDTPILSLENANGLNPTDYNDGKYYGAEFSSKVYTDDVAFMTIYSIPMEMFKKSFMSANDVRKLVALIETTADNTLTVELNALAKSVLRKLALSCNSTRKINLITKYNADFGFTSGDVGFVTLANWKNDTNFKLWCESLVIQLKKRITEMNVVTNDGTIETFTPESDIRMCLLSEFATNLDFAQSSVYHNELTSIGDNYFTTNYWQNSSTDLVPTISATSTHDEIVETVGEDDVTISHMVSIIYSRESCGITTKLDKVTSDYIAKGDFTTFYHHMANQYWVDTRETAIILCLA